MTTIQEYTDAIEVVEAEIRKTATKSLTLNESNEGVQLYADPKYTSQTCSECGCIDSSSRKSQSKFECVKCGHKENADIGAAKEILKRGLGKADIRQRKSLDYA